MNDEERKLLQAYVDACQGGFDNLQLAFEMIGGVPLLSVRLTAFQAPQLTPELVAALVTEARRRAFWLAQAQRHDLS